MILTLFLFIPLHFQSLSHSSKLDKFCGPFFTCLDEKFKYCKELLKAKAVHVIDYSNCIMSNYKHCMSDFTELDPDYLKAHRAWQRCII